LVEVVARHVPGVLGDDTSAAGDSFSGSLLEHPQYTRPVEFEGQRVPEVLLSGNHEMIRRWRAEMALERTRTRRPELLQSSPGTTRMRSANRGEPK
jgi:tRNA (guanine37-N1)-methyltransferase